MAQSKLELLQEQAEEAKKKAKPGEVDWELEHKLWQAEHPEQVEGADAIEQQDWMEYLPMGLYKSPAKYAANVAKNTVYNKLLEKLKMQKKAGTAPSDMAQAAKTAENVMAYKEINPMRVPQKTMTEATTGFKEVSGVKIPQGGENSPLNNMSLLDVIAAKKKLLEKE